MVGALRIMPLICLLALTSETHHKNGLSLERHTQGFTVLASFFGGALVTGPVADLYGISSKTVSNSAQESISSFSFFNTAIKGLPQGGLRPSVVDEEDAALRAQFDKINAEIRGRPAVQEEFQIRWREKWEKLEDSELDDPFAEPETSEVADATEVAASEGVGNALVQTAFAEEQEEVFQLIVESEELEELEAIGGDLAAISEEFELILESFEIAI